MTLDPFFLLRTRVFSSSSVIDPGVGSDDQYLPKGLGPGFGTINPSPSPRPTIPARRPRLPGRGTGASLFPGLRRHPPSSHPALSLRLGWLRLLAGWGP